MFKDLGDSQVIDEDGYRANVGIVVCNQAGRVLWARRVGQDAWQFPQGGIRRDETPEQALYRELWEEIGLEPRHVTVMGCTREWLVYHLPRHLIRQRQEPLCIGQKQRWFLLRLEAEEGTVRLDLSEKPEFDQWRWVGYWYPAQNEVSFKQKVYQAALEELEPLLHKAPCRDDVQYFTRS